MRLPSALRNRYERWLERRLPSASLVVLNQRRIFIFPTGYGFLYLLVAGLLFLGGINYQNNLIMALAFLLGSLFLVAILHTYRNLSGLSLRNGDSESGYAGGHGALQMVLFGQHRAHLCIDLLWPEQPRQQVSVVRGEETDVWLNLSLPRRGVIPAPRLKVESRFPLGLLRTWSYVSLDHYCLAWPQPIESRECPADGGKDLQAQYSSGQSGSDDFVGLRAYRAGDSLRQVDWKGYARGRGLNTKLFEEPVGGRLWLRWDRLEGLPVESRLSVLCYWVLALDHQRQPYGLVLPALTLAPDSGDIHRIRVLDALASFQEGC